MDTIEVERQDAESFTQSEIERGSCLDPGSTEPDVGVPVIDEQVRSEELQQTLGGEMVANIDESERAKRASLTPLQRRLAWLWEPPIRIATHVAAHEVQRRAQRKHPIPPDRKP